MLYPKIPRKSIALLILCLIFTLVAVGISFIIYFYHNTSDFMDNLRNKWALPDSQYHQYQHNADDSYGSYTHFLANDIGANSDQIQHTRHFPSMTNYHGSNNNNNNKNGDGGNSHNKHKGFKYTTNTHNSIDNRLINTGDTIYIDDYDKINEKSVINVDGDLDMTNIEYFDQIISDHASSSASSESDSIIIDKNNKNSLSSSISNINSYSRSNDNNKNNILDTIPTLKDDVIIYTKDIGAASNGKSNYVLRYVLLVHICICNICIYNYT